MQMTNPHSVPKALLIVSILLSLTLHPAAASAAGSIDSAVRLISSDARGITLELAAPPVELQAGPDPDASIAGSGATGAPCQVVNLEGYVQSAEAGQPQLPVKVLLLGVPSDARLSLRVQPLASRVVARGVSVCPALTRQVEQEPNGIVTATTYESLRDPAIYSQDRFYPEQNVNLVDMGFMRSQRIVRLEIYPSQYNPVTGELRYSDKIRVAVEFGGTGEEPASAQSAAPIVEPAAFESSFRDLLLNYEEAKAWRGRDRAGCRRVGDRRLDAPQPGLQSDGQTRRHLPAYLRGTAGGRSARDDTRPTDPQNLESGTRSPNSRHW